MHPDLDLDLGDWTWGRLTSMDMDSQEQKRCGGSFSDSWFLLPRLSGLAVGKDRVG